MVLRAIFKAPGVHAMEKGHPWPVPGNQYPDYSASRFTQLESIHTIIRSTEKQGTLLHSPTSAASEGPCVAGSRQHTEYSRTTRSRSIIQEPADDQRTILSLIVPEVAKISSGGCFDTSNWVFKMVWKHTHHMNTEQLMTNYFYREDRGKYGEHHTSTRGAPDSEVDEDAGTRAGSEAHRYQERDRRVRHRYLQAESDQCISTGVMNIALAELSEVKEEIRRISGDPRARVSTARRPGVKAQATNVAKKLGKDDQLTAVLMAQHMGFILIARLQEDLNEARDEIDDANYRMNGLAKELQDVKLDRNQVQEEEFKSRQGSIEAANWRQRFEKSEAEKQSLEDEVLGLRRQLQQNTSHRGSMTPFMHCSLPLLSVTTQQGPTISGVRGPPASPILMQSASEMHQRKRKRSALELPTIAIQINGQHRMPLSPAPSYEGSPSPSFHSD